jgi:hypothetical protein
MFTDGNADKYNFVHGGAGVGIHVRVGKNASYVTRQKTVVRFSGVLAAIDGQCVREVCGRSVVTMQYTVSKNCVRIEDLPAEFLGFLG